jgi:hypothetical protein
MADRLALDRAKASSENWNFELRSAFDSIAGVAGGQLLSYRARDPNTFSDS